ncbi:MAG: hypothetical protein GY854_09100 [Deltaproteobacteria bacterium]|nr:hypothetical protein [Deltaproteobacteria bacterium]
MSNNLPSGHSGTISSVLANITSDANGRFNQEMNSPTDIIGIIAKATQTDYAASIVPVAFPLSGTTYPLAFTHHDIPVVKNATLTAWSTLLDTDGGVPNHLPLGTTGGMIGSVLCIDSGNPVVGAEIVSQNASSNAKIRYLNADGNGFNSDGITASGIYIAVNSGLAEKFDAYLDGKKINLTEVKAGSKAGYIFVVDLPIECDEQGIEICTPGW